MKAGGWAGMLRDLPPVMTHSWRYLGHASAKTRWAWKHSGWSPALALFCRSVIGAPIFWSFSARWPPTACRERGSTPLIAAFPKMLMPFMVILPGIAAVALMSMASGYTLPLKAGRRLRL